MALEPRYRALSMRSGLCSGWMANKWHYLNCHIFWDFLPIELIFWMPMYILMLMTILIVINLHFCLFLCNLQRMLRVRRQLKGQQSTFSELPYLTKLLTNCSYVSHAYLDLNAFDKFGSFKALSQIICPSLMCLY